MTDPRRGLPSVGEMLDHPSMVSAVQDHGRERVLAAVRRALDDARRRGAASSELPTIDELADRASDALHETHALQEVINASGVVLHTNLGRAVLARTAVDAAVRAAGSVDLEYDLVSGRRDRRGAHVAQLLTSLCSAEGAHVVNNCAAALVLVMAALAHGREVVVSRGELVEIGGSFRLPDIIAASGALLREVGTTNRTRLPDVTEALGAATGAVLRVHPSNFRIEGFTEQPRLQDVAAVARSRGIPLVHDIGSGLLAPSPLPQLREEPDAASVLEQGADLVVFSGDKLLGGPQAGIIVGRADLVEQCRTHPLARALRLDKLRVAALEATLADHVMGRVGDLPTWRQITTSTDSLQVRAEALAEQLGGAWVVTEAVMGGGTGPGRTVPSCGVQLPGDPQQLSTRLRRGSPAVVSRVIDGRVVLDLRSVPAELDAALAAAVRKVRT